VCSVCPSVPVNVNTTDATTGAAALLLPAQNPCVSKLTPASFYRYESVGGARRPLIFTGLYKKYVVQNSNKCFTGVFLPVDTVQYVHSTAIFSRETPSGCCWSWSS
jgi:hypothetical protein